jgi:hypothetical protein
MMSKAKAKLMEKLVDGMMGDFNPEQLVDMMFEKPIIVYAEIAFFKTDTGKLCCTFNKLPKPEPERPEGYFIPANGKVIVIPCQAKEEITTEAIRGDP